MAAGPGCEHLVGRPQRLGRDDVLRAILLREKAGMPLNHVAVLRDDPRLHRAILRLFGKWDRAMTAAGIDPDRVRLPRRWTRDMVLERIRQRFTILVCTIRPLCCLRDGLHVGQ